MGFSYNNKCLVNIRGRALRVLLENKESYKLIE